MKLLLDTCAFLWLAADPEKLSAPATAAINDAASTLHLSDASVWEIVLKYAKGKLPLPEPPRLWIPQQAAFFQLQPVAITPATLYLTGELPPIHQDPFDRLIVAQALLEAFTLITPDPPYRAYQVACLW